VSDKATVFIVDDDRDARSSLTELVESMGLEAVCFASAEAFLQSHSVHPPCCLVTDVRMPGMSGIALQERINNLNAILPVIVISAHATVKAAVKAMQAGAVTFLEKTDSPHELCEAISHALRKSSDLHLRRAQRSALQETMAGLTEQERQVLEMLAKGDLNKQVAVALDVSERTVENRRQRIMKKLGAESFAELMRTVVESEDHQTD